MNFLRRVVPVVAIAALSFASPDVAFAQALSPAEALQHFKLADGFEVQLVASEPEVRQPVAITFDARGRMWVVQYLQYPTPQGLKPVQVDRYLRTRYDRRPEPPPKGPRGADKITILEDTDGDGRADKVKDFVTGLNLCSAIAIGHGGVFVGQAPYLLFYADRDGDDVPDGDPEVLLTGFGIEDAHAVINSLQWGPDGWLYGAQGSTVTADVRGVGFQQGIWRYHPLTREFELFSEGGGNTWGLDFNRHGEAIAGTNFGEVVCLHQVQGGYYVKGFTKHGPLHNPYTYGYFEHVKHTGHAGGHVTCGGIVYQADAFPEALRGAYIGPNLLSNAIYWSRLEPAGSTYTSRYAGTLLETDDVWFRPVDSLTGPDGSLYVADWYDQRANHVIPEDTWDKSNGRIWRISYRGTRPAGKFDLAPRSTGELVDLLSHANAWHRRESRRLLAERKDKAILPRLRSLIDDDTNPQLALEALWALYVSGGWSDDVALKLLDHPNDDVRAWTVRFLGDEKRELLSALAARLVQLAESEPSPRVRSQLACSCKRFKGAGALAVVDQLLRRGEDAKDTYIPLLLWWAIEDKAISDRELALALADSSELWRQPLFAETIAQRLVRRYVAEKSEAGFAACARLLAAAPSDGEKLLLIAGMEMELAGPRLPDVPRPLQKPLAELLAGHDSDVTVLRCAVRLGDDRAYATALARMADRQLPPATRLSLIAVIGQAGPEDAVARLLPLLDETPPSDSIRQAALAALEHFGDPAIAAEILKRYAMFSPPARARAISLLCSRKSWAAALVEAVDQKQIDSKDVSVDQIRQMLGHNERSLAQAIEARWGKIRPATPGEKMSYVPVLGRVLAAGKGDFANGHQLFTKHCGACHMLHGEGNKVGPDLTSADRKNRDALLLNILDPSGYVRPEYVSQTLVLADGRVLTGLPVAQTGQEITIVDSKSQRSVIPRSEIEQIQPASQSLMPERLLETLAPQELRDLFAYLQSDASAAAAGR